MCAEAAAGRAAPHLPVKLKERPRGLDDLREAELVTLEARLELGEHAREERDVGPLQASEHVHHINQVLGRHRFQIRDEEEQLLDQRGQQVEER